jgi:uncharacterized phiE125 gp8 family phage protein
VGALALVTGPTSEPITLAEARAQCSLAHTLDDARLAALILDAREWAQGYTRRAFHEQTLDYFLHDFPQEIRLPIGPVQSVTSISYYPTSPTSPVGRLTLGAEYYDADLVSLVPTIYQSEGYEWPSTYERANAVVVRFVAGYAAGHPDLLTARQAMLLHVEAHYDRDPASLELLMAAAERKLDALRVVTF